jgi:hypothetical protein
MTTADFLRDASATPDADRRRFDQSTGYDDSAPAIPVDRAATSNAGGQLLPG